MNSDLRFSKMVELSQVDALVTSSGQVERTSPNEVIVPMLPDELREHVEVVRPSRPSLTYERME